jgi:hypothetical protein
MTDSDVAWANGEVTCGPMRRFHVAPFGRPNLAVPPNLAITTKSDGDLPNLAKSR